MPTGHNSPQPKRDVEVAVARAAGVSIGALQHHFDTRDDLFRAAFEWSIEKLIARWRASAADEPDPWHRFELLVQALTQDPELERRCATRGCAARHRTRDVRRARTVRREQAGTVRKLPGAVARRNGEAVTRTVPPKRPTGTHSAAPRSVPGRRG
ncbi:TetR/AcrR family transcriptional regulator [Streptomyces sp. NPDC002790]|uniref:TetR/AcrR family transcriptional regulator n=1 Tax=Streptomyces sp. NPDC002790 TaxID=3154431 RepID=UPI00331DC2E3